VLKVFRKHAFSASRGVAWRATLGIPDEQQGGMH